MDFTKLPDEVLNRFLTQDYSIKQHPKRTKVRQAELLYQQLSQFTIPLPIIDLQLASNSEPVNKKYSRDQIMSLSRREVDKWANRFGFVTSSLELDQVRILRILTYMDCIYHHWLLEPYILERLGNYLSLNDINNLRIALNLGQIGGHFLIRDKNNQIVSLTKLNNQTFEWGSKIELVGSIAFVECQIRYFGDIKGVKFAINHGFNINTRFPDGKSALIIAIESNETKIAKYLIDHKIDLGQKTDRYGITAIGKAIIDQNLPIVEYILSKGGKVNEAERRWVNNPELIDLLT